MPRYKPIPNSLFIKNRRKLLNLIKPKSLIIAVSNESSIRNGDQNYPFRQDNSFFYLTGIEEQGIFFILYMDANSKVSETLFVPQLNQEKQIWNGPFASKIELSQQSGIENVLMQAEFEAFFQNVLSKVRNIYTNVADAHLSKNESALQVSDLIYRYSANIRINSPLSLTEMINSLRIIKEPEELMQIKIAAAITNEAFMTVLPNIKPNIKENEIESVYIKHFIANGASGHAYHPIIATGKNACYLHYSSNSDVCKKEEMLLMDVGAEYANYAADMTRTVPVSGKFSKRQKQVYLEVLNVLNQIKIKFVIGNTIDNLNKETGVLMNDALGRLGLIKKSNDVRSAETENLRYKKYFMHGLSHFIGLDVHDVGAKDLPFEKGMVLSCEPGIYIPEEQIGIRIENTIIIDESPIDLMNELPVEPEHIEALMKNTYNYKLKK